jgi:hypothetical protein
MTVPAVRCSSCAFAWNSAAMAEGLRLIGSCPKCGGDLTFREHVLDAQSDDGTALATDQEGRLAPHLVLGIPRR